MDALYRMSLQLQKRDYVRMAQAFAGVQLDEVFPEPEDEN